MSQGNDTGNKPSKISQSAAAAYVEHSKSIVESVNMAFEGRVDLDGLIGANPLQVMRDNHANHARFMSNVFALSNFDLLENTLPWVYRAYGQHGFSNYYFPEVVRSFKEAVARKLSKEQAEELNGVYDWVLSRHDHNIEAAKTARPPGQPDGAAKRDELVELLLAGKRREAIAYAQERIRDGKDLERFYIEVLMPAMYEIGERWERGDVTVAHEHVASAVAGQIMTSLYSIAAGTDPTKGLAVVTAAPGELHEMGARMVADLLECDGWELRYLGADTPPEELVEMLREVKPFMLCVSVAMPFNLTNAGDMISAVRNTKELSGIRIMVGGKTLNEVGTAIDLLGADGFAKDAGEAVEVASEWWGEEAG